MESALKRNFLFGFLLSGCVATPVGNFLQEDGFFIRSYADGSASVALGPDVLDKDWNIDCRVDTMNDRRSCRLNGEFLLVFYGTSASPQEVCVLPHDFPGRRAMIRVDNNPPHTTGFDGCMPASAVLSQLSVGDAVSVRYVEWPYDYDRDATETLSGFNKAMEVVSRIRAGTLPIVN